MIDVAHNLPEQPYKKFFGRGDAIERIKDTLLYGATFIASIDGVGGIGKTALAYHFCKNVILPSKEFSNIIWITAKEAVFDPFSVDSMIKKVNNKFEGINTLIDVTLTTIGFEEYLDEDSHTKKELFEEFIKSESVLIVLDNLENINDESFFQYIKNDFNKFAVVNRKLKVLTTSRKRKRIIDNPIEIEGLDIEDALTMLKYLAREHDVKDILKSTDHDNIILVEKVGKIPLGIEFIIGQMSKGKSRGEIYRELEGYPSLEGVTNGRERKKILSEIILFSFQNMYESLTDKEKKIFQIIAAFQKNKKANEPNISIEFLLSITNMSKFDIEEALDTLMDNKLIIKLDEDSYGISPMSINFVKQYYENFEEIEDEVIGKKRILLKGINKPEDKIDILINDIGNLIEENRYEDAEQKLLKVLDINQDYRIYYELAKVQRILNKFSRAADNFKRASSLNPKNVKIWYDWINMEDNRNRHNIALDIIDKALESTNNDVSIFLQKISIYKFKEKFEEMRNEIEDKISLYEKEGRKEDYLRLLRNWKNIELKLFKDGKRNEYFKVVEKLINKEEDKEARLQLLREELRVARKVKDSACIKKTSARIKKLENSIMNSMNGRIKSLNKLFNNKRYEEAKKEARKILNWIYDDKENIEFAKNALRILLQILASEHDYERIIVTFEDFKEIGYKDENCINIYEKSIKEKEIIQKDEIIKQISSNIQHIELNLREIIMWSLDYDEEKLKSLVTQKGKKEWLEQWKNIKSKSLKRDESLIHYSDLAHLRSLLNWTKPLIIREAINSKHEVAEKVKKLVAYLEDYVSKERNETFHSRLQLYDFDKLNWTLVDTERLLDETEKLRDILNII